MNEEKIDWLLILVIFFGGWLGLDKFYALKAKGWKLFLIKFLANTIGIGELWNILDLVMAFVKKYQADPRDYLDLFEKKQSY
jgi:hypothetical protein